MRASPARRNRVPWFDSVGAAANVVVREREASTAGMAARAQREELMTEGWDAWHSTLGADAEALEPWYGLVKRRLRAEDLEGRRVLEIGCGRGGFACWLAKQTRRPDEIVAADYSQVAVEKGRTLASQVGATGVRWKYADIQALDDPAASYDTVISCETIEHVPNPRRAVAELARVLKPGGRLYLTTPNYLGPFGVYRVYLRLTGRRFTEVGQPINQVTMLPRTLRWIQDAGLRSEQVDGVGHYWLRPGHSPRRLYALDRAILKWFALHSLVVASKPGRNE